MQSSVDNAPATSVSDAQEATPMLSVSTFSLFPSLAIRPGRGVNGLKPKPPSRIGIVTLTERGPRAWGLRYVDPETGQDVRRRLSGLDLDEVRRIASHISQEALAGKGFMPGRKKSAPTIKDALAEAIRLSRMGKAARKNMAARSWPFVAWLRTHHSHVKTWDQLKPSMVKAYLLDMERQELAYDSVRLRMATIKTAWRLMAENYPDLVKPLPKIRQSPRPRREIECLDAPEVATLLSWLKTNAPDLWPMANLQALAGLRMLEAAALRVQDVDLDAGTLTVCDTGSHKPKTVYSARTIPICHEALEALREAIAGQKIRPVTGELFTNRIGNLWTVEALSRRWTKVLRRAAKDKSVSIPQLATIPARKLRAAFATTAGRLSVARETLKAYMGHAPGDVLGGHYQKIDLSELKAVSDRMNDWRSVSKEADSWQDSGNRQRCPHFHPWARHCPTPSRIGRTEDRQN